MATVLDLLTAPDFAADVLTEAINVPPYQTGRPAQLGIFADRYLRTTYVEFSVQEDEITIIPSRERGGEHNKNMRNGRGELMMSVPHFPLDDAITPMDIQNINANDGEVATLQTLAGVYNDKLASVRAKHDLTFSHLDWGALRGLVVDGEGKVLINTFTEFAITQDVTPFAFTNDATDLASRVRSVKEKIRRHLRGTPAQAVRILAGGAFYDAFVSHPFLKAAAAQYPGMVNPARDEITDTYNYVGVTLERIEEEYPFRQPDNTFALQPAIPANEAIAIPLGTPYFRRYFAPPNSIFEANRAPTANTRIFVSTHDLPHGQGRELHTQSNVLPVCLRPQLIQRLTMA
jgi:hypothetical protein